MTGPAYGIRLTIDATGSKAGRDAHVRSIEDIKRANAGLRGELRAEGQAARELQEQHRRSAQVLTSSAETYRRVEAELRKMGLAGEQLAQAMRRVDLSQIRATEASARHSRAVQHEINQLRGLAIEAQRAAAQNERLAALRPRLQAAAAGGVVPPIVPGGGVTSEAGLRRLQTAAQTLAVSLAGVPGPAGRVVSILGTFAIGGGWTLGVTAGIAAIAALIARIRQNAEEARRPLEEFQQRLDQFREEQTDPVGQALQDRAFAEERVLLARRRADSARFQIEGQGFDSPRARRELANATRDLAAAERDLATAEGRLAGIRTAQSPAASLRAERDASRDLAQTLQILAAARRQLTGPTTRGADEVAVLQRRFEEERRRLEIANRLWGAYVQTQRDQRLALQDVAEAAANGNVKAKEYLATAERQVAAETELLRIRTLLKGLGPTPVPGIVRIERPALTTPLRPAPDRFPGAPPVSLSVQELEQLEQKRLEEIRAVSEARRELAAFTAELLGLPPALGRAADAVFQFLELQKLRLARTGDRLLVGGTIGLAAGQVTGSGAGGAIFGAAGGYAAAGPLGAVAGGISGFISGLFTSAEKARQAAAQMREANAAWERALEDFLAVLNPRTPLQQAQEDLRRQWEDLVRNVENQFNLTGLAQKTGDELRALADQVENAAFLKNPVLVTRLRELADAADALGPALERLIEEFQRQQQLFLEDLHIRELRAQGLTAEADAQQLLLEQGRERFEAEKAGYDAATLARLDYIHGLERERFNLEQTEKAIARVVELQQNEFSLRERELRLQGLDRDAAEVRAEAERASQIADAERQFRQGDITAEFLARLLNVIEGEFQDTIQNLEDPEDQVGVSLAVGVAESTVQRLIGIQQSQIVLQQSLPRIEAILARMEANGGSLAGPAAPSDVAQGSLVDQAQLAQGLPPSNLN